MEEDIKVLEEFCKNPIGVNYHEVKQAIENLIARNKELEEVVKTYNAIPNDYIPNDMKIVIADREYFNSGIFKENMIPKSKVREKIKEYNGIIYYAQTEEGMAELKDFEYEEAKYGIQILVELLQEGDTNETKM